VVSLFYDHLLLEVILFVTVSVALLYFTRPLALKYFGSNREKNNQEDILLRKN
jgi:membrane protein implicated in regulation of membrane protease activity